MARIVRTFTVERPATDVFDAIADFATAEEWDPGVRASRPGDGPRVGEGATWHVESGLGPVGLPLLYTTTTWDRPDHVVHRTENWFAVGEDDVRVVEERGTTTVTWDARFTFRGPGRLVDAVVQKGFEGVGDRAVRGLENWLRAGGRGHDPS
ncbi:SRPBCC family protein [Salsipaludibacter albus]|uniref:SRPBCC family protein n=1 Tax=Salsipaludibacter albus TaxID=2849650 RepID=UPI001EE4E97C|nr:SRPBCC family protein [Salsipaludibacter albus]